MDKVNSHGISLYIGLDNTHEENICLLQEAAQRGIRRVFTSFHIPETDTRALKTEIADVLSLSRKLGMGVVADISPQTCHVLGLDKMDMQGFADLGIATLRLDYGFSTEETVALINNNLGITIQLNASTVTGEYLDALRAAGANMGNVEALHNFFPRENTGLSESFVARKNNLLHAHGVRTAAFIPSFHRPRSPLKAGLPTLELHRTATFDYALRHLIAMGTDAVFVGDSLPSKEEMAMLGRAPSNTVVVKMDACQINADMEKLLSKGFTARSDEARDVLRTQESRIYVKEMNLTLEPANILPRPVGTVTVDNKLYGRYQGELQITKVDLPADERVNVLGYLSLAEQRLLKYITPERKFRLIPR